MKIRRIIPWIISIQAQNLNKQNERKVEKFRQKLLTNDDFNFNDYYEAQDLFEKDMLAFEKELEELGLNIDFGDSDSNLAARSESSSSNNVFQIPSSSASASDQNNNLIKNMVLN